MLLRRISLTIDDLFLIWLALAALLLCAPLAAQDLVEPPLVEIQAEPVSEPPAEQQIPESLDLPQQPETGTADPETTQEEVMQAGPETAEAEELQVDSEITEAEELPADPESTEAEELPADPESTDTEELQVDIGTAEPYQNYESLYYDYQTYFQDDEFGHAIIIAKKMLKMVEDQTEPNDIRLFEPLINLAAAQKHANQPEVSVENYERAIVLVEIDSGIFDTRLIEPLQEVGNTYRVTARSEDALDNLRRAQHLTHRKDGVMTIEQEEILDGITETYLVMGMYEEANQEQILSLRTYEHTFGKDDPRIIPAIHKLARFEMRIGQYRNARELYQRSLYLMEQNYDENDIRMLEPLEGIAMTRRSPYRGSQRLGESGPGVSRVRLANANRSQGTRALERSLEIIDARNDVDAEDRATALLNLADWKIEGNKPAQAAELYKRVWDTLIGGGQTLETVQQSFSKPRQLAYSPPSLPIEGESGRYVNYDGKFVEIEFTVMSDGGVRHITIVDSNSPVVMHRKMRDTMKSARYRPVLVDGFPVDTPGIRLRQTFSGTADIWKSP